MLQAWWATLAKTFLWGCYSFEVQSYLNQVTWLQLGLSVPGIIFVSKSHFLDPYSRLSNAQECRDFYHSHCSNTKNSDWRMLEAQGRNKFKGWTIHSPSKMRFSVSLHKFLILTSKIPYYYDWNKLDKTWVIYEEQPLERWPDDTQSHQTGSFFSHLTEKLMNVVEKINRWWFYFIISNGANIFSPL